MGKSGSLWTTLPVVIDRMGGGGKRLGREQSRRLIQANEVSTPDEMAFPGTKIRWTFYAIFGIIHPMEIEWHGSSKRDLMDFPPDAKSDAGHALRRVQMGLEPSDWKPMSSIGAGVREIRVTRSGGSISRDLCRQTERQAARPACVPEENAKDGEARHRRRKGQVQTDFRKAMMAKSVFEDLYPPAEARAMELRSQLLIELQEWIKSSGLRQGAIAELLCVDQPRVSDIKNGKLSRFTIDRLVEIAARAGLTTKMTITRKAKKAA